MSTFVAVAHADASTGTSMSINKPTGTVDNDIMFALIKIPAQEALTATGWTLLGSPGYDNDTNSSTRTYFLYKIAASEGASYTFSWTTTGRNGGSVYTVRGGFNTATPIDVVSNTSYETSDTTARAAGMTVAAANSVVIVAVSTHTSTSETSTAPTVPSTFTEDVDVYDGLSRNHRAFYRLDWTGSGATGNMDVTLSATNASKHAFAVALAPSGGGSTAVPVFVHQLKQQGIA